MTRKVIHVRRKCVSKFEAMNDRNTHTHKQKILPNNNPIYEAQFAEFQSKD